MKAISERQERAFIIDLIGLCRRHKLTLYHKGAGVVKLCRSIEGAEVVRAGRVVDLNLLRDTLVQSRIRRKVKKKAKTVKPVEPKEDPMG